MATAPKIYAVGTLRYTVRGLCVLFAWLLWGDFAFTFFESIFGRFIPLYLNDLHASNSLIGIMSGSIAGAVNLFLLPGISQWSDRCRTPWGRRIPFLAVAAPLAVVALVAVGFAPEIGDVMYHRVTMHFAPALSESALILTLLCLFATGFHYFNMVLCNAFVWLQRDVVPQELMARFLSWFRLVSTLSGMAFTYYVFPYVISLRKEVCVGVGLFYLIVFFLMCWKIREGDYAPPAVEENQPGIIKSFFLYFKECFAIRLYRYYFYTVILGALGNSAAPFFMLFYRNNLGLNMGDMGQILTLGIGVTALALLPMGWLCDKFTPIKIALMAQLGMFLVTILSFFFIQDKETLIIFTVAISIVAVAWGISTTAFTMTFFPTEKFGQFYAGVNIFGMATGIISNYLIGLFLDWMGGNYRMSYLWSALSGLALIPWLLVYRDWKKHGGPDHYVPPLSD